MNMYRFTWICFNTTCLTSLEKTPNKNLICPWWPIFHCLYAPVLFRINYGCQGSSFLWILFSRSGNPLENSLLRIFAHAEAFRYIFCFILKRVSMGFRLSANTEQAGSRVPINQESCLNFCLWRFEIGMHGLVLSVSDAWYLNAYPLRILIGTQCLYYTDTHRSSRPILNRHPYLLKAYTI